MVAQVDRFQPLMRREDGPRNIADYYLRDEPQLSLHVVSFADATLVSLSWPHTFLDAMGRHELLTAWTAVLEGRDGDVKALHGVDQDPFVSFGTGEVTEPVSEFFFFPFLCVCSKLLKEAMFRCEGGS